MAQHRSDVANDRLFGLPQHRQGDADHLDGGKEVHFHDPPQPLRVGLFEWAHGGHAGVVDQDVEPAEGFLGRIDDPAAGFVLGDVAGHIGAAAAEFSDLVNHRVQTLLAAGDHEHVGALSREFQSDRPANAAGGAGDSSPGAGDFAS